MTLLSETSLESTLVANEYIYSEREKEIRTQFVKEYLVDRDQLKAAIRCGFPRSIASEYAVKFMEEPFVVKAIAANEAAMPVDDLPAQDDQKRIVLAGLFREAQFHGHGSSHSARVAALSKLTSIHGMEAPTKIQQETTHKGGVMVIPGNAPDLATWEKAALESQAQLTHDSTL